MAYYFQNISFFYSKFVKLPVDLISLFDILKLEQFEENDENVYIEWLNKYINSKLYEETDNRRSNSKDVIIKLYTIKEHALLYDFMEVLHKYKDDFKYFINVMLYLSNDDNVKPKNLFNILKENLILKKRNVYQSHVLGNQEEMSSSLTSNTIGINDALVHNNSDKIICIYIQELCRLCIEDTLKLNIDINSVIKNIMDIKDTLFKLTNIFENTSLRKITLYLDLVIPFSEKFHSDTKTFDINKTHILHLILNALNEYRLDFCKPLKYEYASIDKNEYALKNLNNKTFKNLGYPSRELIPYVKFDFKEFERVIEEYKTINNDKYNIMFLWKGEKRTFETIYSSIYLSLSCPKIVLSFFVILYKFSFAEFVYATSVLLNNSNSYLTLRTIVDYSKLDDKFPETFKEFIDEYNKQWDQFQSSSFPTYQEINNIKECLLIKLEELGIYTNIFEKNNFNDYPLHYMENKKKLIYNLVSKVNELYKTFFDMNLFLSDEKQYLELKQKNVEF